MDDTSGKALVAPQRRIVTRVVRVIQQPVPAPKPDGITQREAQAAVAKFSRAELQQSLNQLVYLRDFASKDSVRLAATTALIKLALLPDTKGLSDTDVQALGISSEELSEFLRKVSNATPKP